MPKPKYKEPYYIWESILICDGCAYRDRDSKENPCMSCMNFDKYEEKSKEEEKMMCPLCNANTETELHKDGCPYQGL